MPLSLVLHTHMPYVEGYGTWPFGEEWLWEAMATCYLPLLDVLAEAPELTLSLTPVLVDQLTAPGASERFRSFLADVRPETHRLDAAEARAAGDEAVAAEIERAAGEYARALERFDALDGDLAGALAGHAAWTSSATHAVLPLCATDGGVRLQVRTGIEAHRSRTARPWRGGFWLPECAYAPWLEPLLREAGAGTVCVDLTDVHGAGAVEHLVPLDAGGLRLVPIDRATIELVWSDGAYPAHPDYRDSHRKTRFERRPWRNDGDVYDAARAAARAREHARDFAARVAERLAAARRLLGREPLCVCALDTELLGHWWHEGVGWLEQVVAECRRHGVALAHLDDAVAAVDARPAPAGGLPVSSWGAPRDLTTWSGPAVAGLAWSAREAELRVLAAGGTATPEAVRELLALQSSDWAFVVSRETAAPYGRERAAGHREQLEAALRGEAVPGPRHLAPQATAAALVGPA